MKKVVLAVLILASVACSNKPKPSEWKSPYPVAIMADRPEKPHDWIAEMKAIARENHMRYRIICTDGDVPTWAFVAYVESGTWDDELKNETWISGNGATQELAAEELVGNFTENGFHLPKPEEVKQPRSHRRCPPPIKGEEFVEHEKSKK